MEVFLMKEVLKKYAKRYFIDAMGAMALGLFASLLIGTIFKALGMIPGLSVLAQIGAGLFDHPFDGALQNGGTAGDGAHKGHIAKTAGFAEVVDGVVEDGTHQNIAPTFGGDPGAPETFLLVIGDDLQNGGFAAGFHGAEQGLHLFRRQADFLEAPVLCPAAGTQIEDLRSVGDRAVVMGEHHDQIWDIFHDMASSLVR